MSVLDLKGENGINLLCKKRVHIFKAPDWFYWWREWSMEICFGYLLNKFKSDFDCISMNENH